jgi:predicted nucleotidyltransferase
MHAEILRHRETLVALCRRHGVARLDVFGSAARGVDFDPARSDVDLLVSFAEPIGFGFMHLGDRLEDLLGRRVDLVASDGIKENRRPFIMSRVIHVAP